MRRILSRTTLVCADTLHPAEAVIALKKSMEQCLFADVILFTDKDIRLDDIRVVQIPTLNSKEAYSKWVVKELYKHFDTDFVLIQQHDSWVLNSSAWTDEFYDYSYIGALWPWETDGFRNGNGGFSLRSKEFCRAIGTDEMIKVFHPEDAQLCRLYRPYLEEAYGFRWAPDEMCERFAYECGEPIGPTFGFHGNFHTQFKPSVLIQRMGALGDVLTTEPLLRHFYNKGFHVYLHTSPQFEELFAGHDFPVKMLSEKDGRISVWHINLDMSYESKPDQLHLKSYFEYAGIWNYKLTKPRLTKPDRVQKLFDKYCVLHLDNRNEPYRNIRGINWGIVVDHLKERGYEVFQLGESPDYIETSAIRMRTPSIPFLKYVVGHSDLFIGIDSGISHIASAMDVPSIIFFGSVLPEIIHPVLSMITPIQVKDACETPGCWSFALGGTTGQDCVVDKGRPPCCNFDTKQLLKAINKWTGEK